MWLCGYVVTSTHYNGRTWRDIKTTFKGHWRTLSKCMPGNLEKKLPLFVTFVFWCLFFDRGPEQASSKAASTRGLVAAIGSVHNYTTYMSSFLEPDGVGISFTFSWCGLHPLALQMQTNQGFLWSSRTGNRLNKVSSLIATCSQG